MNKRKSGGIFRRPLFGLTAMVMLGAGHVAVAADTPDEQQPLTGEMPEFGYGFFEDKSIDQLVPFWASDNPGLRNMSALEVARRIWQSENPVSTLKSLLPRMRGALKSENPNERRAVADVVYGLQRAGGMHMRLRVRLSDEEQAKGWSEMRQALGVLLPTVCKNIQDDPDVWARSGAVNLAAAIIDSDGMYDKYARIVRPLLLVRARDDDKFMQGSAGRALDTIGIDGLPPEQVIKAMSVLIDSRVDGSCDAAYKVLSKLTPKDLAPAYGMLIEALASDAGDGAGKPAITAAKLIAEGRPPKAAAAVIDYVTRERHGMVLRESALFPLIPKFTDDELRGAIPELTRLAVVLEVKSRRQLAAARRTIAKLENKEPLEPTELIALDNARTILARPPYEWVLELFDRIGEPRPKLGVEVTGPNPDRNAELTMPPWIPGNTDESVPPPETDGLIGERAMDALPGKTGGTVPIDPRAFADEEPESNCAYLAIQTPHPEAVLRRPLGPTGIMGTFSGNRIFVMGTEPGSPAHGKIMTGDWILGVNDHSFTSEPRIGMGWAIEESEGRHDGAMELKVLRDGKRIDVTIHLQPLGRFVDTWPYNCAKSEKIYNNLCEFIVRHDADWVIPGALFLLASGEDKYMNTIRRKVYEIAEKGPITSNWFTSYKLILLDEYYEKTGDANILPAITTFADDILSGQTYTGGYLHNRCYYNAWKDASKTGYGELNMAGLSCFVSLILANECGVEMNNTAFRKTIDYFKIFSGRGCVPYGAFPPYIDSPETGGKTAIAGLAFDLLGRADVARPYVAMSGSAYEYMWTGYDGGSYWNATWRPLAVARDSAASFKRLTRYNLWHYNLSRHWHGGVTEPGKGKAGFMWGLDPRQVMGFGMIYALPRKAIRLTGAPRGVFTRINALGLEDLKKIYDSRDDEALKTQIDVEKSKAGISAEKKAALDALWAAADRRRQWERVELGQLTAAVRAGDFYTAEQMMTSMAQAGISVPEKLSLAVAREGKEAIEEGGQFMAIMTRLLNGPTSFSSEDCVNLAAMEKGAGFYAARARQAMADYAVPADGNWRLSETDKAETVPPDTVGQLFYLISPSLDEIRTLRVKSWVTDVGGPHPVDDLKTNPDLKGWYKMDYDDTDWPEELGPYLIREKRGNEHEAHVLERYEFHAEKTNEVDRLYLKARFGPRTFRGRVYLNGEAVVEFNTSPGVRGRSRGHRRLGQDFAYIKLPAKVTDLLKEGRNVLAVRADLPPVGSWSHPWLRMVDVGLGATRMGGGTFRYDPMLPDE